jgi:putative membrane-bound dehydrogenase-like protein
MSAAAEPDYRDQLPRIPPLEPTEALASFRLSSDHFAIDQVAAEPLVASPVALDFDADGRMFVVEMRDYSEQDTERLGRVRLLEDKDNDGRFEKSTVFADDLSWPTAVACADGGVFVGAAPEIYFLKDTDDDGRADVRTVVFTGFKRDNVQGLLNSFQWGLDNRLHGTASSAGGDVRRADVARSPDRATAEKPISLRGRDFSFDTRTLEMRPESGGAQHGMSFDEWGRKFVCSNSDHIQLILAEDRYLARNPYLAAPIPRVNIAADGPQAEVFRDSPVEPWRILRTRLRVAGTVPGPIEGGGRPAGYFTSATGVTIYRGNAWTAEYRGNAFIGDVGSNIVHRKTLSADGLLLVARRAEKGREFLASRDIWFRPAQFANGPDGNLYVIDVYREVIEHPASLHPSIKKHLDLTSGRDRGRIYRIRPEDFKRPPPVKLSRASIAELVSLLEHPNGWHRQTASRLLYERNDNSAVPLLIALAENSKSPLGRVHALRALGGLGGLQPELIETALKDPHPGVRRHAVQLSELLLDSPAIRAALKTMVSDNDLLVRYQLAYTLGELPESERTAALVALARRDADHEWMRVAIQSSLATGAGDVFSTLTNDSPFRRSDQGRQFLQSLAQQIGAQQDKHDFQRVVATIDRLSASAGDREFVEALALGAARAPGGRAATAGAKLHPTLAREVAKAVARASAEASDVDLPVDRRLRAIETMANASPDDSLVHTFGSLLDAGQPDAIQLAAMAALSRSAEPRAAELLLDRWHSFSPRLRAVAIEALVSRRATVARLLDAVEAGDVARSDLDAARVGQLLRYSDRNLRQKAARLFGEMQKRDRDPIVREYQTSLNLTGSADKGKAVFKVHCAGCHRGEGEGHELGPNLATAQNRGPEAVLVNVLDPNREVNPQYVNYLVVTNDGRTASGIIAGESATTVTLRRGEGLSETILRGQIDEMTATGLSLMPEGFEKQIDVRAMADLLAYLATLK